MEATTKCILVPTDFSEYADHAVSYAGTLAARIGARLLLMYADALVAPIDFSGAVGGWSEDTAAIVEASAMEALLVRARTRVDPSVPVRVVVRSSTTEIDGIIDQARESGASLIVMGTHGRSGVSRLLVGSVTEAVMRGATVPVLAIARSVSSTSPMKTIVCLVEYSVECYDALTFAAELAGPEARFVVARTLGTGDVAAAAVELATLRSWVPAAIASRCEFKLFTSGHVARQIEDLSRSVQADLIVASEPAQRSAKDIVLGSYAEQLLQHAGCPVLTVDSFTARLMDQQAIHDVLAASSEPGGH